MNKEYKTKPRQEAKLFKQHESELYGKLIFIIRTPDFDNKL